MIHIYRIGRWFNSIGFTRLARVVNIFVKLLFQCHIDLEANISSNVKFPHNGVGVIINKGVTIYDNTMIMQHVTIGGNFDKERNHHNSVIKNPIIGKNVFIGPGACIVGPVTIGDNVKISGNCFINYDIPSDTTVILSERSHKIISQSKANFSE